MSKLSYDKLREVLKYVCPENFRLGPQDAGGKTVSFSWSSTDFLGEGFNTEQTH